MRFDTPLFAVRYPPFCGSLPPFCKARDSGYEPRYSLQNTLGLDSSRLTIYLTNFLIFFTENRGKYRFFERIEGFSGIFSEFHTAEHIPYKDVSADKKREAVTPLSRDHASGSFFFFGLPRFFVLFAGFGSCSAGGSG